MILIKNKDRSNLIKRLLQIILIFASYHRPLFKIFYHYCIAYRNHIVDSEFKTLRIPSKTALIF